MSSSSSAAQLIRQLGLQPHPEGGWYRETWRAPAPGNARASATSIYFLLEQGQRSHWHKVDAAEIWLWHAGSPAVISTSPTDTGPIVDISLGGDVLAGETPQLRIEPGHWQSAHAIEGWTLVSCIVSPGFEFDGFELAPAGWEPRPSDAQQ
jgi:predicted cupin superfamily sugar epimerase